MHSVKTRLKDINIYIYITRDKIK